MSIRIRSSHRASPGFVSHAPTAANSAHGRPYRWRARAVACAMLAPLAWAHDPGFSSVQVTRDAGILRAELTWSGADFAAAFARDFDRNGDGAVSDTELNGDGAAASARRWLVVERASVALGALATTRTPLSWREVCLRREADGDVVATYVADDPMPQTGLSVQVPALAALPFGHRQFATLRDGERHAGEALLSARWARVSFAAGAGATAAAAEAPLATLGTYLCLGVEHVLTGYDHLLFLLALLLAVATWRRAMVVVAAFSVSHSLSLALAVLDFARLPAALVECAIAASVAVVGAENLLQRAPRARARWALAFGLVHGFGFAGCLAELGVARGLAAARPLLGFNLGIELGQLLVVTLVLPVLLALRLQAAGYAARVHAVLSAGVLLCGLLWLLQRWP